MGEHIAPTEATPPGIITHYLPQFLLKQFRGECLKELDKGDGNIAPRKVKKAGQQIDLYPPQLENGQFRIADDSASRIFRYKIVGQCRISLSAIERRTLSEWLMLMLSRNPYILELCDVQATQWNDNPAHRLSVLDDSFDEIMRTMQREKPERYRKVTAHLGEDNFRLMYYQILRQRVLERNAKEDEMGHTTFVQMNESGKHREYAERLHNLHWTWLRTNGVFVIGDNPLCRWDTRHNTPNHGLAKANLEITMPITTKLTLWMHRNYNHAGHAVCNRMRTDELNRRQIMSARRYVYAESEAVLMQ